MSSAPTPVPRSVNAHSNLEANFDTNLRVTGQLPAALTGQYICFEPDAVDTRTSLADRPIGRGSLHVVTFDAARATYRNRCMPTDAVPPSKVIAFGPSVLALSHGALAYQLDAELGTVGRVDLAGGRRSLVADAKVDSHTGELHLLTFDSVPCQMHVVVSPGALTRTIHPIEPAPSPIRQFELTSDDVVFVAQGLVGVAARARGEVTPIWFAIDTEDRRVAAAFAQEGGVVAYATGSALVRWTLDRGASTARDDVLDSTPQTSATRNPRQPGSAQRFLWTVSSGAAHKHDVLTGGRRSHDFDDGRAPGELIFVPDPDRSATEDGGWLVGLVHDDAGDHADFVVLDAAAIERPAVASVHIPHRIPFGTCGTWNPTFKPWLTP